MVKRWARAWKQDDGDYSHVLRLDSEKELRQAIAQPILWSRENSAELEAFLCLAANHFNLSWQEWARRNRRNRLAIQAICAFCEARYRFSFYRPRLRSLAALSKMDADLVREVTTKEVRSARVSAIIEKWVLSGQIAEYLRRLTRSENSEIARTASIVLAELDPGAAVEVELPVDPRDVPEPAEPDGLDYPPA